MECVDPADCNLQDSTNPEKQYILKEAFSLMSEDAKLFTKVLMEIPDDYVTSLGKPIQKFIIPYMKKTFGWTALKTTIVQAEIAELLEN
jgi:hypothetical protein